MTRFSYLLSIALVLPSIAHALVIPVSESAALKRSVEEEDRLISHVVRQEFEADQLHTRDLLHEWRLAARQDTTSADESDPETAAFAASLESAIDEVDQQIQRRVIAIRQEGDTIPDAPTSTEDAGATIDDAGEDIPDTTPDIATELITRDFDFEERDLDERGLLANKIKANFAKIKAKIQAAKAAKAGGAVAERDLEEFEARIPGLAAVIKQKVKDRIAAIKAKIQAAKAAKAAKAGGAVAARDMEEFKARNAKLAAAIEQKVKDRIAAIKAKIQAVKAEQAATA